MTYSPTAMACLLSLPKLHTYQGRLQQLKIGGEMTQIRNITLTDWFSPSANFGDILGDLHHLELLAVCVNFIDNVYSQLRFYGTLLNLRSLIITRVHTMNGRSLTKSALHIAAQNPNLREFTIRDVPVWDHLDQLSGIFRTKQLGRYTVGQHHCDGQRVLNVQEVE
ncbi:hypothetical protein J3R30DRAFT_3403591 [Lentinula aciculospora]|uniref:Uncharacterized protein n=1 Tax=Lentinula aciculospora TaxID=153920 RepID=A0A9W9AD37_9AGAR|nr:hypothetical protein J3R30DRAFT_3403591 [Lentinula aciculospora]